MKSYIELYFDDLVGRSTELFIYLVLFLYLHLILDRMSQFILLEHFVFSDFDLY